MQAEVDSTNNLITLLINSGIGITLIGGVGYLMRRYFNRKDREEEREALEELRDDEARKAMKREMEVQDLLSQFAYDNNVSRVSLSAALNSGAVITVGTRRYVSVYFEVASGVKPIKKDYQKYPATDSFMDFMRMAMIENDIQMIVVDALADDNPLKHIYDDAQVSYDFMAFIKYRILRNDKDELLFLNVQFNRILSEEERGAFLVNYRILLLKLKKLL